MFTLIESKVFWNLKLLSEFFLNNASGSNVDHKHFNLSKCIGKLNEKWSLVQTMPQGKKTTNTRFSSPAITQINLSTLLRPDCQIVMTANSLNQRVH